MDRDEYFRILEEASCYNIENYVFDREWVSISGLSHIQKNDKEENRFLEIISKVEEENKALKKDKNIYKILE